jgi:hypothetical protein
MNYNDKAVDGGNVQAIDVHGHAGIYCGAAYPLLNEFFSGGIDFVCKRAHIISGEA